jgi:hypothetical protein
MLLTKLHLTRRCSGRILHRKLNPLNLGRSGLRRDKYQETGPDEFGIGLKAESIIDLANFLEPILRFV